MNKNMTYVAAPYTILKADGTEDMEAINARMQLFASCMAALIKLEINACSPLLMHFVRLNQTLPGDWAFWMGYSEAMLTSCKGVIVLTMDGWRKSAGVQGEIDIAALHDIPLIYMDPQTLLENS